MFHRTAHHHLAQASTGRRIDVTRCAERMHALTEADTPGLDPVDRPYAELVAALEVIA